MGGPALTWYLTPTDEELFQKYSPELKKKSLEGRYERQKEFDDFVGKLKEYSKSDKPSKLSSPDDDQTVFVSLTVPAVWIVQAEEEKKERQAKLQESLKIAEEVKARKEEMRREAGLSSEPKR